MAPGVLFVNGSGRRIWLRARCRRRPTEIAAQAHEVGDAMHHRRQLYSMIHLPDAMSGDDVTMKQRKSTRGPFGGLLNQPALTRSRIYPSVLKQTLQRYAQIVVKTRVYPEFSPGLHLCFQLCFQMPKARYLLSPHHHMSLSAGEAWLLEILHGMQWEAVSLPMRSGPA